MRRHHTIILLVAFAAVVGATSGVASAGGSFTDDDGSVFESDIEWLAAEGITRGCNPPANTKFCPDSYVTRAQMAAFLTRALGYTNVGVGNLFTDDDGSVFEDDIDRLGTAGVTKGCNPPANTKFCPDSYVTRAQMAAFLTRALGYTNVGVGNLFTDDDGSVFEDDIDRLGTAGVTKGCNPPANTKFCPDSYVTRAQMAAFLHRALGLGTASNTLRVHLVMDDSHRKTAEIGPDGGTITGATSSGQSWTLTVPPGALSNDVLVVATPIAHADGLPAAGGFLAGLDFAPEGLRLMLPATLHMATPRGISDSGPISFGYRGDGSDTFLIANSLDETGITLSLLHFSGAAVTDGPVEPAELGTPDGTGDTAVQEIMMILRPTRGTAGGYEPSSNELEEVESIITDWLRALLLTFPKVTDGTPVPTWAEIMEAANDLVYVDHMIDYLDKNAAGSQMLTSPAIKPLMVSAWTHVEELVAVFSNDRESRCTKATDLEAKRKLFNELSKVQWLVDVLDLADSLNELPAALCDRLTYDDDPGTSIVITPPAATLDIGDITSFTADIVSRSGKPLTGNLEWGIIGTGTTLNGVTGSHASVTGVAAGESTLVAVSTSFPDIVGLVQVVVRAPAPDLTIDKALINGPISIGDDANFSIVVSNNAGTPITGVTLDDPLCDALLGPDESATVNGVLDVGEAWNYLCSVLDVQAPFTNTATVDSNETSARSSSVEVNLTIPPICDAISITGDETFDVTLPPHVDYFSVVAYREFSPRRTAISSAERYGISASSDVLPGGGSDRGVSRVMGFAWPLPPTGGVSDHPNFVSASMVDTDTARVTLRMGGSDAQDVYIERFAWNTDQPDTPYSLIFDGEPGGSAPTVVELQLLAGGDRYLAANRASRVNRVGSYNTWRLGPPWGTIEGLALGATIIYADPADPAPDITVCSPLSP